MRYAKLTAGLLVECAADDPEALVLFSAEEVRDIVLRRDLVTDDVVAAIAASHESGCEPELLRQVAKVLLGRARSPMEPKE